MTENTTAILSSLPHRLRVARQKSGLSLEAVAQASGISRSMVSQVERGESSPTIATLLNLARALNLDIAELLGRDTAQNTISVTRSDEIPIIEGKHAGCTIRVLSASNNQAYELLFSWGGELDSEPHASGTVEHLTVVEGKLDIQSGQATQQLAAGDTASYRADIPHRITAKGKARAFLIVDV